MANAFHGLNQHAVGDGFPELLAQRRVEKSKDKGVTMAHICWALHVWFGSGHSRNWAFREADISTNK